MAAEVKKGKLHFVQTQEIKKGRITSSGVYKPSKPRPNDILLPKRLYS